MHLWEKYANIHAIYEIVSINDVTRIAKHNDDDDDATARLHILLFANKTIIFHVLFLFLLILHYITNIIEPSLACCQNLLCALIVPI